MIFHKIYYIINLIKQQFSISPQSASALKECLLAEEQAIAIYEAECWILRRTQLTRRRKKTLSLCLKILDEERAHRTEIGQYVSQTQATQAMVKFSRLGGYLLGGVFSVVPSRLNWKVHAWAELEAAKIYGKASALLIRELRDEALVEALSRAERQETEHSRKFQKLALSEFPET